MRTRLKKIVLFVLVIILTNKLFGNSTTEILIIYPHFFKNTRTLIGTVDSIFSTSDSAEVFVFISNEYNSSIHFGKEVYSDVKGSLSVMAGNLVPDFKYDIKKIVTNQKYKELIADGERSKLNYHFFIPADYWQHWQENKTSDITSTSFEMGIIPKYLIHREHVGYITVYLPQSKGKEFEIKLEGIEIVRKTL